MATVTPRFGPPVPRPLLGVTLELSVNEVLALKTLIRTRGLQTRVGAYDEGTIRHLQVALDNVVTQYWLEVAVTKESGGGSNGQVESVGPQSY